MTNTQVTYHINKLTKWLLAATLFFSIFGFSGYASNSQSKQQATRTELVISNNHKICKRTISYYKTFKCISFNDLLNSSYKNWTDALFAYNKLTRANLIHNSKLFYSHKPADHFLPVKTIPQNSDDYISATFIG